MASLLSSQTADTTGTLTSHTGPCTAVVFGDFDGCRVTLELSASTNTTDVVPIDRTIAAQGTFRNPACVTIDAQGTYYLRANVLDAGSSTSVSVTTTQ